MSHSVIKLFLVKYCSIHSCVHLGKCLNSKCSSRAIYVQSFCCQNSPCLCYCRFLYIYPVSGIYIYFLENDKKTIHADFIISTVTGISLCVLVVLYIYIYIYIYICLKKTRRRFMHFIVLMIKLSTIWLTGYFSAVCLLCVLTNKF
jgi:uncharacterized membrane protein